MPLARTRVAPAVAPPLRCPSRGPPGKAEAAPAAASIAATDRPAAAKNPTPTSSPEVLPQRGKRSRYPATSSRSDVLRCRGYAARRISAALRLSMMAATPMPPAVHTEISPRPPCSASSLARLPTMRAPVAANGWPKARLEPLTLSLARSMAPSGCVAAEILLAVGRVLEGLERGQHLRGERLVDLVEVEVLQLELRALEHARDGDGRRHQQPLALDEVVGRGLRVGEVGLHGQRRAWPPTPRDASSTAAAPSVSGVELAAVSVPRSDLSNAGLSVRDLLQADVLAQVVVAEHAGERHDQVVHVAGAIGLGRLPVALVGQLVLLGAGDLPLLRHQLGVLAHGQARARLADVGRLRRQLAGREALEGREPLARSTWRSAPRPGGARTSA